MRAEDGTVRLIDIVFPGDANHHGTLFGGAALAHMDKVAFIAASRHGRSSFVTASSDRIDFRAPARIGDLIEAAGRVVSVGRTSLRTEVELTAENPLTGERRLCTRGLFTLVAQHPHPEPGWRLPPLPERIAAPGGPLRMVEMVFPAQTNHYGTLFGGDALRLIGKAAFVAATRYARKVMVMAAVREMAFKAAISQGDLIELTAEVRGAGVSSLSVAVEVWSENLLTGQRRHCVSAEAVMVAVDSASRPVAIVD